MASAAFMPSSGSGAEGDSQPQTGRGSREPA